jgi:hypothetical protein
MSSLTDFDAGGTFRPFYRVWLGSSLGWLNAPGALLLVTTAGTTSFPVGISVVRVNVNGAVTIQLPVFKAPGASTAAMTQPALFIPWVVTILDEGGFAGSFPITVLPGAGETISGFSAVQISTAYGAMLLQSDPILGGSTIVD